MHLRQLVLASVFTVAFGLSARATGVPTYLLTIDVTDPSSVTITATGAFPEENSSATTTNDGIDLLDFLKAPAVADPVVVGGLSPAGTGVAYDSWSTDSYSGSAVDINLYSTSSVTQNFTTTSAAFTGTWTGLDFSAFASDGVLRCYGESGDILAGWSSNNDGIVGQWVIVPEPSHYGYLIALGVIGLFGFRRFSNLQAFRFASAISR